MLLEIATAAGALAGAAIAKYVPTGALAILLGCVLVGTVFAPHSERIEFDEEADRKSLGGRLQLNGAYPVGGHMLRYSVRRVPFGFGLMGIAGALSGLLGIGSGAVKVLAMDLAMGLPFKVSTTTSNFMIGVTAAASAGVYLHRGYIDPGLAMPVTLGVAVGALTGAKLLAGVQVKSLRMFFRLVILALGIEMIYNGCAGRV
jgi:hypothetical protein